MRACTYSPAPLRPEDNYEWCGASTYQASGWETIVNDFKDLPVAAYMSEYGYAPAFPTRSPSMLTPRRCITNPPRLWQEVAALYAQPTSDVFSGGIAFSYFPTSDGYGMVQFSGDGQQWVAFVRAVVWVPR